MLVHFPIVLGALGLVPVLFLAMQRFSSRLGSAVCVAWFLAAMTGLGLASTAGEEAYERVEESSPPLTQAEHDALEEHESLGEGAWLWALPAVVLAGATLAPKKAVRLTSGGLLVVAAAALAGFVAVAGHTGGKLVYEHGLGVPQRGIIGAADLSSTNAAPREDGEERHDDDDD